MNRYLLNISYIGTKFRGIQKTVNKAEEPRLDTKTVQGCLEIALQTFKPKNPIVVHLSSRTDAGVHALHSTVHVDLQRGDDGIYPVESITGVLNRIFHREDLPIRVISTLHVPDTFHCRYNAKGRTYLYRIAVAKNGPTEKEDMRFKNFTSYIPVEELERCYFLQNGNFNIETIKNVSKLFLGKHDFRTFMSTSRQTNKAQKPASFTLRSLSEIQITAGRPLSISPSIDKCNELYDYWDITITGRSFLYKQVRRIVGTLIAAGTGRLEEKDIYEMLTIPSKYSWNPRIELMPPFGLYLCRVHYDPEDFKFQTQ